MFFMVEPSFKAMKLTDLLPRRVLTQPFTVMVWPEAVSAKASIILVRFIIYCENEKVSVNNKIKTYKAY